ncbi:hypothetical protein DT426_12680 [Bacillus cereus]|uniref:hypothetical protein n=1 Tax=Bacillus cereus TaxID=1396 RepID=UPI000FD74CAD|nr:hypothetical protein [Bacillus cereus]AZV66483.1 hypothetical protein DT426_12680 [Bacillus cereus]
MQSNEIIQARVVNSDGGMDVYEYEETYTPDEGTVEGEIVLCEADIKEVKMDICYTEKCTPLGCVEIPYPCAYERVCTHQLKLTYYYPEEVEEEVKTCINQAAVAGGIAALPFLLAGEFTSAIAAGKAAFIPAFEACLSDEIERQVVVEFSIGRKPKEDGGKDCEWNRV